MSGTRNELPQYIDNLQDLAMGLINFFSEKSNLKNAILPEIIKQYDEYNGLVNSTIRGYFYSSYRKRLEEISCHISAMQLVENSNHKKVNELNLHLTTLNHTLLSEYNLELMSTLSNDDKNNAASNTIYLSLDNNGIYVVRDDKGIIQEGSLKGINLNDLPNRLHDEMLRKQILEITSKAGHTRNNEQYKKELKKTEQQIEKEELTYKTELLSAINKFFSLENWGEINNTLLSHFVFSLPGYNKERRLTNEEIVRLNEILFKQIPIFITTTTQYINRKHEKDVCTANRMTRLAPETTLKNALFEKTLPKKLEEHKEFNIAKTTLLNFFKQQQLKKLETDFEKDLPNVDISTVETSAKHLVPAYKHSIMPRERVTDSEKKLPPKIAIHSVNNGYQRSIAPACTDTFLATKKKIHEELGPKLNAFFLSANRQVNFSDKEEKKAARIRFDEAKKHLQQRFGG